MTPIRLGFDIVTLFAAAWLTAVPAVLLAARPNRTRLDISVLCMAGSVSMLFSSTGSILQTLGFHSSYHTTLDFFRSLMTAAEAAVIARLATSRLPERWKRIGDAAAWAVPGLAAAGLFLGLKAGPPLVFLLSLLGALAVASVRKPGARTGTARDHRAARTILLLQVFQLPTLLHGYAREAGLTREPRYFAFKLLAYSGILSLASMVPAFLLALSVAKGAPEASGEARPAEAPISYDPPLSLREKEVARLLLEGKRNKEIAVLLSISTSTVKKHVNAVLAKSGRASRIELLRG